MEIRLPKSGKVPVALPHFPTKHQAFIFRAYEYVPPAMIEELAVILREEDFLDIKLGNKPVCEPVVWRELTKEEAARTRKVKEVVQSVVILIPLRTLVPVNGAASAV